MTNLNVVHLPRSTGNAAGSVSVAHVVDVAQKLKFFVHSRDDGVQTISNEGNLFVELGVTSQRINGDFTELGEVFLDARSLLEEPFPSMSYKKINIKIAVGELIA
jgi:hypothetical protein